MKMYHNNGGNSNVKCYEIGDDYIDVVFYGTAKTYRYSYASAGRHHVEQMKKLAEQGEGLNSYIMKYARFSYER